jgi:quercetin dioxygenase-like cupin family protein
LAGLLAAGLCATLVGHAQQPARTPAACDAAAGCQTLGGQRDLNVVRLRYDRGARADWHRHERGQLLFVEEGHAQVHHRDQPVRELRAGDYDYTPAGVEHRHGASGDSPYVEVQVNWLDEAQQQARDSFVPVETRVFTGIAPTQINSSDLSLSRQRRPTPGDRSLWHLHAIAQLLFIEEGRGRVQQRGAPMKEYRVGEADFTKGVEHWQGTAPDSPVVFVQLMWPGGVKQLAPVTDAEYHGR